jgi:hypothetical protein
VAPNSTRHNPILNHPRRRGMSRSPITGHRGVAAKFATRWPSEIKPADLLF